MKNSVLGLLLFFWIVIDCSSQEKKLNEECTFMFYNTENFFDSKDDSLTQDDEFTTEAGRRWNFGRVQSKANRLSKVILAAGKWNTPIVVGLCEIENREVLDILVKRTLLSKYGYKIIHKDSPDDRGSDVALIYRPELFKPFDYKAIPVTDPLNPEFRTRDILLVNGILNNCDTIHIFVNHWPSRYGGMMETMRYRGLAASILKKTIQEVFAKYPKAKVICMGDFNDGPEDDSMSKVLKALKNDNPDTKGDMINLSFEWITRPVQTIKNLYSWQVFDQWIVSDYFIESKGCLQFIKAEIFDTGFLLEPDKKYGGLKPKRTYIGFKYQDGFSDHLPVLLRFKSVNH